MFAAVIACCEAVGHADVDAPTVFGVAMIYRHAIDAHCFVFEGLRDLLAKATPPRSGHRLAGVAAETAEQMIAARMALADVPLRQFLHEPVVPYEEDEVTRLIIASHYATPFPAISSLPTRP